MLGRDAQGWHALDSLVAFAGVADFLRLAPDAPLSLAVDGPYAAAAGPEGDNLVLKAARALQARVDGLRVGRFFLTKHIPVAAGLGGGSSDAAAALRALARLNAIAPDDSRLIEAARSAGSDAPVCLDPRLRRMQGRGEILGPPLIWPPLCAVLANPNVAAPTAAVFAAMGLKPGEVRPDKGAAPAGALLDEIRAGRNDMEAAALRVAPAIADVLAALRAAPEALLARMSGSGATCFALFDSPSVAARAARRLKQAHPQWWLRATLLR